MSLVAALGYAVCILFCCGVAVSIGLPLWSIFKPSLRDLFKDVWR